MTSPVIDPKSGKFTLYGHRVVSNLWKRTGGYTDDMAAIIGLVGLVQASALQTGLTEEKTRRILGDGLAQLQAQQTERVRSELDAFKRTTDAHFGQLLGALSQPPLTRVISFSANDTWRPAPGLRAVQVFAVGGGGGGGGGSQLTNRAGGGGGSGGGYSLAYFNAEALPDSVSVTVGAAGAAGGGGTSGGAGGSSSFGAFMVAVGGTGGTGGGISTGAAGVGITTYGAMFFGGDGGDGTLVDGNPAPNLARGAPGGGGGGGYNNGAGAAGGAGSWRATSATGGGGAGGASGTNGASGVLPVNADVYLGPGLGGGGGGGATTGDGGNGAAGVLGGGGGGGGAVGTGGSTGGSGGAGGEGRVWVLEFY